MHVSLLVSPEGQPSHPHSPHAWVYLGVFSLVNSLGRQMTKATIHEIGCIDCTVCV